MKTKQHCWHFKTVVRLCYNDYDQVCCWCGAKREMRTRVTQEGHGEHLPYSLKQDYFTEPDRECVEREVEDEVQLKW